MALIARAVAPGIPHHVTQRGNRRQQTFFRDEDFQAYLELMSQWCATYNVQVWAYCLMPNHFHLIAVPETKDGLNLAIGEAHRRYARRINFRQGWRGHLWQGRFKERMEKLLDRRLKPQKPGPKVKDNKDVPGIAGYRSNAWGINDD